MYKQKQIDENKNNQFSQKSTLENVNKINNLIKIIRNKLTELLIN